MSEPPMLTPIMHSGNWTDPDSRWEQMDTHERHCVAAGKCDWRDSVWAYCQDGPPVAPRPGSKDHVFIYAPQCVDMRTLPPNVRRWR